MDDAEALALARAMTANRVGRRVAAAATRVAFEAGAAGVLIALPDREPARRDTYLAVNRAAWCVLGGGRYTLRLGRDRVLVTRIDRV